MKKANLESNKVGTVTQTPKDKLTKKVIIVVLAILVIFGILVGVQLVKNYRGGGIPEEAVPEKDISEFTFERRDVGTSGLSLELPGELKFKSVVLPKEIRAMISSMDSYGYESDTFSVDCVAVSYNPGITPSLRGAEQGAIANLKNFPGVKKFKYTSKSVNISGAEGVLLDGRLQRANFYFKFRALLLIRDLNL
ncbi:hypothetical protein ACFL58_04435 [Elusimicrobiota bacterium]